MTEKQRDNLLQLIEIWDTQGRGKFVIGKDKDGKIKYWITKEGDLE